MDKTATDILREEHNRVLSLLNTLEDNLNSKKINESAENINFLETEFDEHSLNKEEKILFPELDKIIPREGGPVEVMILEHKDIVASIKEFKTAHDRNDFKTMAEQGKHIINVLRQHIDKENNILFMIADMHLDYNQKSQILKQFEERELKHKCCPNC